MCSFVLTVCARHSTFVIVAGGIATNVWCVYQLKRRILDDTFQLRWVVIKERTAIITVFQT